MITALLIGLVLDGFHYHLSLYLTTLLALILSFTTVYKAIKCQSIIGLTTNNNHNLHWYWLFSIFCLTLVYAGDYFFRPGPISKGFFDEVFRVTLPLFLLSLGLLNKKVIYSRFIISILMACVLLGIQVIYDSLGHGETYRSAGMFQNEPIIFATSCSLFASICFYIVITKLLQKEYKETIIYSVALVSVIYALILTDSRGPILSFMVIVVLVSMFLMLNHFRDFGILKKNIVLFLFFITLVGAGLFFNRLMIEDKRELTIQIRLHMWSASIESIKMNPVTGIGFNSTKNMLKKYVEKNKLKSSLKPILLSNQVHNIILQNLLGVGFILSLFALIIIFMPLFLGLSRVNFKEQQRFRHKPFLLVITSVNFLVLGLTDDVILSSPSLYTYLLLITIILVLNEDEKKSI